MLPSLQPGRLVDMESLVPTEEFVEACASFGIVCEPEELERLGMFFGVAARCDAAGESDGDPRS